MYSVTLWWMNWKSQLPARCAMLSVLPVRRLSMATTARPSESRRSHRCEPRKPAPPVTRTRSFIASPPREREIVHYARAIPAGIGESDGDAAATPGGRLVSGSGEAARVGEGDEPADGQVRASQGPARGLEERPGQRDPLLGARAPAPGRPRSRLPVEERSPRAREGSAPRAPARADP